MIFFRFKENIHCAKQKCLPAVSLSKSLKTEKDILRFESNKVELMKMDFKWSVEHQKVGPKSTIQHQLRSSLRSPVAIFRDFALSFPSLFSIVLAGSFPFPIVLFAGRRPVRTVYFCVENVL